MQSVKETATYLGVHPSTVRRYIRRGLPHYRIGRRLKFKQKEVDSWLEARKVVHFDPAFLNTLPSPLPCDTKAAGGDSKLAKKGQTCFNYGFDRIYVRTYESGKSSWTISYYDENRKRIQKAVSHAQTKEDAAAVLQQEIQGVFDRKHGIEQKREKIGFRDFSKIYLQDYAMVAKRSWKTDASSLTILNEFFKDIELRGISPLMIQKFRAWRLREGNTKSTCNRYLALLKRMFNVAIEEGYAEENRARKVKMFSEKDNLKERILSKAEEEKLMEACADHLKPILTIALHSGMRRGEILSLNWNQVNLETRRIKVERTKSGTDRTIPINDVLLKVLKKQRNGNGNGFVFFNPVTEKPYTDVKNSFKSACRRAGIEGMRFHDLRHTFASRLIQRGCDIETVRELLGHSSIVITQRYIHSDEKTKRKAVELLSGDGMERICDVSVTQKNLLKVIH